MKDITLESGYRKVEYDPSGIQEYLEALLQIEGSLQRLAHKQSGQVRNRKNSQAAMRRPAAITSE